MERHFNISKLFCLMYDNCMIVISPYYKSKLVTMTCQGLQSHK